ncbi:protein 4.1 [Echinococcus multilocularis]|uniref:Protein 4.1 n=1 Tax=Echinococcus multilocularis TaxID=6211 RepID=A0A068XYE7_ECHMU|nr:protein 4.1 [Echinococcus multilocularis]
MDMFTPNLPGRENLPGFRSARESGAFKSPSSNRSLSESTTPGMQETFRHNEWNSSPYSTWNGRESRPPRPHRTNYNGTVEKGSTLPKDIQVNGEQTPLPHASNSNALSSSSHPSTKPRFWTPRVEPSPEKKSNETFVGKFLASFRRKKIQKATSSPVFFKKVGASDSEKPPKPISESVTARILLLDGEEVLMRLSKRALGLELLERICDGQDIIETDYFGITYTDKKLGTWFWLDVDKKIIKQVKNVADWQFYFQVKFYPPEPTMLQDETTRYQLVLQVRQDVYTGKLPCSWVTQALLGSFLAQSELGDYDSTAQGRGLDYLRQLEFVRSPTDQLLQKILELHKTHKGMKPGQADIKYLETAKRLDLYGLDLHPARDMENVEIYIGVGYSGIVVYRDRVRIGRFAWPKVLRISYKKNYFYLKIRPDYTEPEEAVVGFLMLNAQLAKRLWKTAVEHHTFFRLKEPRPQKRGPIGFLGGSSRFQYSGKTFFQYRTTQIDHPKMMAGDALGEGLRPSHHRTASVPVALNRAGIRYNSVHSLNRTHPRDMTIGKAQSSDYLGPTIQHAQQPIRNETSRASPTLSTQRPPPSQPVAGTRVPPPKPLSRRNLRPPAAPTYIDNDGSLFDAASSRGEGSILDSGIRGADYEIPRQLSANEYSSYAQDQEDPLMFSGGDFSDANDVNGAGGGSVAWSASNSYNPQPSQDSWGLQNNTPPSSPSPVMRPSYSSRGCGEQPQYTNLGYDNPSDASPTPLRPVRRARPYAGQTFNDHQPPTSNADFL